MRAAHSTRCMGARKAYGKGHSSSPGICRARCQRAVLEWCAPGGSCEFHVRTTLAALPDSRSMDALPASPDGRVSVVALGHPFASAVSTAGRRERGAQGAGRPLATRSSGLESRLDRTQAHELHVEDQRRVWRDHTACALAAVGVLGRDPHDDAHAALHAGGGGLPARDDLPLAQPEGEGAPVAVVRRVEPLPVEQVACVLHEDLLPRHGLLAAPGPYLLVRDPRVGLGEVREKVGVERTCVHGPAPAYLSLVCPRARRG
eukprot:CAMPEP_0183355134 /NCGR_PEP_ID=MMETSP0164_2-20130417/39301_1 /TAXON_ID=221442 /ORGANISM="Coccolithus pelagicus ssp braarudi, Strain PLY182g" /LENGTH=259 /DNA_ID=CAMNT_0025528157 /DNA_START=87 /DNA_END=864 /DNA_ORIENTATION=-